MLNRPSWGVGANLQVISTPHVKLREENDAR